MNREEVSVSICSIAKDFYELTNRSMRNLVEANLEADLTSLAIDERQLSAVFSQRPELVDYWLRYSEDRRSPTGWYIEEKSKRWSVSYFGGFGKESRRFTDRADACAFFVVGELQEIVAGIAEDRTKTKARKHNQA